MCTEQHPYFTNFTNIYYLCGVHDETSTYAKPHMKMNTGHTQARVCVDCVGKDTYIGVTTKRIHTQMCHCLDT